MVGTPNIKITTSMIDEFQSPFKDNPNTYIKISQDGLAQYLTPDEVAQDIGGGSGGENTSTIWTPGITYRVGDIVSYNNSLFQSRQEHVAQEPFDFNKWQLLAGYFKTSKFFYDPVNEITTVVLDDAVANKESLSVNINNLLLQSNNYTLADDGKTLTFNEPIEPGTNIEVIVYGNMIIPTNVSQVVSKSFTTTEESTTEFPLGEKVLKKDLITVNIENSVIMNSEWDLNETLDTVILKNAVPIGTRVQISWFNNLEVQVGATYTPHINKVDRDTTLSWTNDGGLENPADSHIYDGVTFVPSQSKTGTETTLSWTNNGDLDNPENVVIKDGAIFTPQVETTPHEVNISWTNDAGLDNPDPISIYTNYAQRIVDSFTATEGQTEFVASHEIYDKSVLSVNIGNTELTYAAYTLGTDKKTVTLVNGLSEGTLVNLKYFYNLNIGVGGGDSNLPPISAETAGLVLGNNGTDLEWVKGANSGLEIGDIGFSTFGIDETQNKRRYLNGQVISQTQFATFTDKVKAAIALYPSLSATEENWQAEVTNSKLGQCGKFVIDDTAGTIRLPKVVNINGLTDLSLIGGIKAESLPNITGNIQYVAYSSTPTGAFKLETPQFVAGPDSWITTDSGGRTTSFNASRSSSTYQDNAPVQQEAVQYPYFIQVATGSEESVDVTREIELNNPFSLFESKYSIDTIVNASWLISNGTYHSGATYVTAYQALVVENNTSITTGTTVTLPNGSSYTKQGLSAKLSTEVYTDYDFVLNTTDTTFRLPLLNGDETLPDYNWSITKTFATTDSFTAPANGYIRFSRSATAAGRYLNYRIDGVYIRNRWSVTAGGGNADILFIKRGQVFTYDTDFNGTDTNNLSFAKALGNGSLYYYVGETIQDANVINAAGVLTRVANSIDRTVASDRETVVGWGMPDYSAGISLTGISSPYIAPANGIIYIERDIGDLKINGNAYVGISGQVYSSYSNTIIINKGDSLSWTKNSPYAGIFYPFKGVN